MLFFSFFFSLFFFPFFFTQVLFSFPLIQMYINYLYIITLLFTATSIYGAPVFSTPKTTEIGNTIKETLSEYYENIIDQVMLDVSEDTLSYIPQSISHDNVEGEFIVMFC